MNRLLTSGTAAVIAIGATPTAMASASAVDAPAPAEMGDSAELTLVSEGYLPYPEAALRRHIEGECTLGFLVRADGGVGFVEARTCSSPIFKPVAEEYGRSLRYAPREGIDAIAHEIVIKWRGFAPARRGADRQRAARVEEIAQR